MKSLFLVLAISALCAISSVHCGCGSENRRITTKYFGKYVECIQYKSSDCLHCTANGNFVRCDTKPAIGIDPAVDKGPTPNGYYAIGSVYTHKQHSISWANLYPRKQNGHGWWDYYRSNPDVPGTRSHIGLHPGQISWGCVTVTDKSCWNNLEKMLKSKSGNSIIVSKTLFRIAEVKRIGNLQVVD